MCIIFTVCSLGLLIFFHYYEDESYIKVTPMVLCTIIFATYTYIELLNIDLIKGYRFFYYSCFIVCSITACIIDFQTKFVYDILQVPIILMGACFILYNVNDYGIGMSLILFSVMQGFIFQKMYGAADVLFFIEIALLLATLGYGLKDYLILMLLSFFLLGVVQICKKNINKRGNLKQPTALFPYIVIALAIFLII